jgi:hypothetical protein
MNIKLFLFSSRYAYKIYNIFRPKPRTGRTGQQRGTGTKEKEKKLMLLVYSQLKFTKFGLLTSS